MVEVLILLREAALAQAELRGKGFLEEMVFVFHKPLGAAAAAAGPGNLEETLCVVGTLGLEETACNLLLLGLLHIMRAAAEAALKEALELLED